MHAAGKLEATHPMPTDHPGTTVFPRFCTGFCTKAHLARAMLEAIAWQSREVLDAMRADMGVALEAKEEEVMGGGCSSGGGSAKHTGTSTGNGLRVLRVDGGAAKNGLLMQLQVHSSCP